MGTGEVLLSLCCCCCCLSKKLLRAFCAAVMAAIRCSTVSTEDFPSTDGIRSRVIIGLNPSLPLFVFRGVVTATNELFLLLIATALLVLLRMPLFAAAEEDDDDDDCRPLTFSK